MSVGSQSNILSLAVPEWIHAAKNSVEYLDPAPRKYTAESLDLALNLFARSHRKYNTPSFLLLTSISVGSIPTAGDTGPGEQYLESLEGNHTTDDWEGGGKGMQNRYQMWTIPPNNLFHIFWAGGKIISRVNGSKNIFQFCKTSYVHFFFSFVQPAFKARKWNVVYSNKNQLKLNV